MKFRYLGDKEDMVAFGYDFSGGNEPDVTDKKAIQRLSGNSHFEAIPSEDEKKRSEEKEQEGGTSDEEAEMEEQTPFVADVIAEAQAVVNEGAEPLPSLVTETAVEAPPKNKGGRPRKVQS